MEIAGFDSFASAPMPSLAIQGQLRKLFKLNYMETVAVRRAATWISEWELKAQSFDELVDQFRQVMWQIYCYAMSRRTKWDVLIYKTLGMALGAHLASKLPLGREYFARLRELRQPVPHRADTEEFAVSFREFMEGAGSLYTARFNTGYLLAQLQDDDLSYLDDLYRNDMDEAIQSFLAAITQLAGYGVKSCVMRDNLLHPVDYAWVMNDGRDTFSYLAPEEIDMELMDPPLALTILTKYAGVRTSTPTKSVDKMGITAVRRLSFDFGATTLTSADIYSDGRVTLDTGFGMVPLRSVFEELKMSELYKPFHLLQLMRIYDLVVPVERAKAYGVHALPIRRWHPGATEKFELTWRRLVVPRIRLVDDPRLIAALEQEIAQDLAFTADYAEARESREVTGFLRRLQEGHHASETARELARKERGWLNLPEGYTYVKNHNWGTGPNRTAGHMAVRRPSV